MLVKFEFPFAHRVTPSLSFQLKLVLAGLVGFIASVLFSICALLQALFQTLALLLCLVTAVVLAMVLLPLQMLTFPLWIMFWLVVDTVVVLYCVYLYWRPTKVVHEPVAIDLGQNKKAGK